MPLKLELEEAEVNQVLGALAQRPFAEVMNLIPKIREQATSQMGEMPVMEPVAEEDAA